MVGTASTLAVLASLASTVLSHGYVANYAINGAVQQGFLLDYYYDKVNKMPWPSIAAWYAENTDSGFIAPSAYQTSDINCHKNSANAPKTVAVPAGGAVKFLWVTATGGAWPHPYGPILTYLAACPGDCAVADKTALQWFKIDAVGIDYGTQKWAQQTLINQNNTWTTTIPKSIAPGNYVLRHELIALHGAGTVNGAQNYPQCFNVQITGSGTAKPSGTLGTALYKSNDPGILINPYTTITSYAMPGPTLFAG